MSSFTAASEIVLVVADSAMPNGAPWDGKIENWLTNAPARVISTSSLG